jgi:hypothetical protein
MAAQRHECIESADLVYQITRLANPLPPDTDFTSGEFKDFQDMARF